MRSVSMMARLAPKLRGVSLVTALLAGLSCASCGSEGSYIWYTRLPRPAQSSPARIYTIGVGDSLSIRVYEQDSLNSSVRVRSDGRISMPLVGEVYVVGKQPQQLAKELETLLKRFLVVPRVTVTLEQSRPISVTVLGETAKPGTLTMERPAHLLQAIAQAGGLTEFADKDRIFVLRQLPAFMRIRFTYDAIVNNENSAASFELMNGDVLVVE